MEAAERRRCMQALIDLQIATAGPAASWSKDGGRLVERLQKEFLKSL